VKKLFVFVCLCASCVAPVVSSLPPGQCSPPPEDLFGAKRASCKELDGLMCCGYGATVLAGELAYGCGYILCRAECAAPWQVNLAMCLPGELPAPAGASSGTVDETL
jgi:hypothetical protein